MGILYIEMLAKLMIAMAANTGGYEKHCILYSYRGWHHPLIPHLKLIKVNFIGPFSDDLQYTEMPDVMEEFKDCTMAIIVIKSGTADDVITADVCIVLEGEVVIEGLQNVVNATTVLFGLIYSLNLSYPKKLKYFFEVIQKIVMELDDGRNLSPKVQGLKNKLLHG